MGRRKSLLLGLVLASISSVAYAEPIKITLVGINDLHGNIFPRRVQIGNAGASQQLKDVKIGGAETMAAYFEAVREETRGNVLFLDSGDMYQGTFPSNQFQGLSVVAAYNALGIQATTFGNHEFDFKKSTKGINFDRGQPVSSFAQDPQGSTKEILNTANFPYLSVNVASNGNRLWQGVKATQLLRGAAPQILPSRIFNVGGIRVGVIGGTTENTPNEAEADAIEGLKFNPLAQAVATEARLLRDPSTIGIAARKARDPKGEDPGTAQVVVLIVHAGGVCNMHFAAPVRGASINAGDVACAKSAPSDADVLARKAIPANELDEVSKLIKALPAGTIDAVLAGHVHSPQAHFIAGVPVVQTFGFSSSFSRIDLTVNSTAAANASRNARILKAEILGQTYFCRKHFSNYPSCNPDEAKISVGQAYPSAFGVETDAVYRVSNKEIKLNFENPRVLAVRRAIRKYSDDPMVKSKLPMVVRLPRTIANDRLNESAMGDCVADIVKAEMAKKSGQPIDLYLSHSGGIRDSLVFGDVTGLELFQVLPFGSHLAIMKLTGAELEAFGGILGQSPKNIAVLSSSAQAPWKVRLDRNLVFSPTRHKGFLDEHGISPDSSRTFTVVTDQFNAEVSDQNRAVFAQAHAQNRITLTPFVALDVFTDGLRTQNPLPDSCTGKVAVPNRTQFL